MKKITDNLLIDIMREVSIDRPLSLVAEERGFAPGEFFQTISEDPGLAVMYKLVRSACLESLLDIAANHVRAADSMLELKKATTYLTHLQWKVEKLIPEVYGAKVQIDVHKTINIQGALDDAEARSKEYIETAFRKVTPLPSISETTPPEIINPEDLLG